MLFRDQRDKGEQRTLPTPNPSVLLDNIDFFIKKWKHAESNGWFIVNDKVLKQLAQLKVHASKGCLSGINPGCGTNRNENLHRNIVSNLNHFQLPLFMLSKVNETILR